MLLKSKPTIQAYGTSISALKVTCVH